jgi:uncharacterized ferritin-like protein (DUF455 family)
VGDTVKDQDSTRLPSLREVALALLRESEPRRKLAGLRAVDVGLARLEPAALLPAVESPGRPPRPTLVHPARVPRRSAASPAGRAALLHAIAHIEFNAINLALDAVARFADMPADYYRDWWRVAGEEALHFELLTDHLATLGFAYGDFPAHDGLWEAARKTADDCLARMALVPRVLEARGLDVTPGMRARLVAAGDEPAAAILDVILRDEIGHVAIGNRWFHHLCAARGLEPIATFAALCDRYGQPPPRPPFNEQARLAGGFSVEELRALAGLAAQR